jgi:hypothetical protein
VRWATPPAGRLGANAEATAMAAESESARSILTVRMQRKDVTKNFVFKDPASLKDTVRGFKDLRK